MSSRPTILLLASLAAVAVAPAAAQSVYFRHRTGGYSALGFGGGNFTLTCDSACGNNKLSSAGASLMLGRHFSQRLRAELGFQYQSNRDSSSNAFSAQLGVAVYLVGNLFARGGVAYHRVNVEQTSGSYDGSGGPGFSVGAGYDLYLGHIFALTPYVNYTTGKISTITIAAGGTTGGTLKTLNFGVAASLIRGTWICVTASGQEVRVTPGNRAAAMACLNEVERRIGRPTNIKR
jgi:hypothetical protein